MVKIAEPRAAPQERDVESDVTRAPHRHRLDRRVIWQLIAIGVAGGVLARLMTLFPMAGDPRVFAEIWSTGIVLSPDARIDIVEWARPATLRNAAPYNGIDLGTQPLARAFEELAGIPVAPEHAGATGGAVRSLALEGSCQLRIGWTGDGRLEFRVQPMPDDRAAAVCTVTGEIEPPLPVSETGGWGGIPQPALTFARQLGPADRALLRFAPDASHLPLQIARFPLRGVGFGMDNREATASMIRGGVLRFPDFISDGENQVYVLNRMVGRGHPIHAGDQLQLGNLTDGAMLHLEIGDLIHTQMTGNTSSPRIADHEVEPSLLQQLNDQNSMIWVFAFALGAFGVTAAIIEAAR